MAEYRLSDGRLVTVHPDGSTWLPRDMQFARHLRDTLREQRAGECLWGSLGHHLALQAAWRLATERMEAEL